MRISELYENIFLLAIDKHLDLAKLIKEADKETDKALEEFDDDDYIPEGFDGIVRY